jgi:hypothetical protein
MTVLYKMITIKLKILIINVKIIKIMYLWTKITKISLSTKAIPMKTIYKNIF